MQRKFQGLTLIALALKIVGAISLLIAFVSLIMLPLIFAENDSIFANLGFYAITPGSGLIGGVVAGVLIFIVEGVLGTVVLAIGGVVDVLISIEQNTRAALLLNHNHDNE